MNSPLSFQKIFNALILRPLIRDGFRTAVTVLGVAIGVAVFLSIRLANMQTLSSFQESVDLVLGRADAVIHADGLGIDEKIFARLLAFRDTIKAYPVVEGYGLETKSGEVVEFLGTDLLQDSGIRDFSLKTTGQDLAGLLPLILDPEGVILPEKFIPGTAIQPGDTVTFLINGREKALRVNGVLEHRGIARALNGNFALLDIAAAQNILGRLGKLDRIDLEFLDGAPFTAVKEKLQGTLPAYLKIERPERKNRRWKKCCAHFNTT